MSIPTILSLSNEILDMVIDNACQVDESSGNIPKLVVLTHVNKRLSALANIKLWNVGLDAPGGFVDIIMRAAELGDLEVLKRASFMKPDLNLNQISLLPDIPADLRPAKPVLDPGINIPVAVPVDEDYLSDPPIDFSCFPSHWKIDFRGRNCPFTWGTPLHMAVAAGQWAVVKWLVLEAKIKLSEVVENAKPKQIIDKINLDQPSLGICACTKYKNRQKLSQQLWTPLHIAICHGHTAIAKLLIRSGANLIVSASKPTSADEVDGIRECGVEDIEDPWAFGHTPGKVHALHTAAVAGRLQMVEHLISKHDVDPGVRDHKNKTALTYSVKCDGAGMFDLLYNIAPKPLAGLKHLHLVYQPWCSDGYLQAMDSIMIRYWDPALDLRKAAAKARNTQVITRLCHLHKSADFFQETILLGLAGSAANARTEISADMAYSFRCLLKGYAPSVEVIKMIYTAAASTCAVEYLRLLDEEGPTISSMGKDDVLVLFHRAIHSVTRTEPATRCLMTIKYLLKNGADPHIGVGYGGTDDPVYHALEEMVALSSHRDGRDSLTRTIELANTLAKIIKKLLRAGAQGNIPDDAEDSAVALAEQLVPRSWYPPTSLHEKIVRAFARERIAIEDLGELDAYGDVQSIVIAK
jgi:hypothetical protein